MTADLDFGEFGAALDLLDQDSRKRQWLRDGPGWVTERLGEHIWSKQREILDSIRDHRRTAVRSCHGVGKVMSPPGRSRGG